MSDSTRAANAIQAEMSCLFDRLWKDFSTINSQAKEVHFLLEQRGETIVNDHVAFRTFSDSRVGIDVLARPFVADGYMAMDEYNFKEKKLTARHFEHLDPHLPKVFISELRLGDCSRTIQEAAKRLIDQIPEETLNAPDLCIAGRPWSVSFKEAQALANESEYAGWLAAFGFRANHFTILVNELKTVSSLQELNDLLTQAGFPLNREGGEIKGSPEAFLEQSSTVAPNVSVSFSDGDHPFPGCYYEFARRYLLPSGKLFNGFVTSSADKIFQSTDRRH
jgi:hypothetical protein